MRPHRDVFAVANPLGKAVERGQPRASHGDAGQKERGGAGCDAGRTQPQQRRPEQRRHKSDKQARGLRQNESSREGRHRDVPGPPGQEGERAGRASRVG